MRTTSARPTTSTRCSRTRTSASWRSSRRTAPASERCRGWLRGARPELLASVPDSDHRRRGGSGERQHGEAGSPADDDQPPDPRHRQRIAQRRHTSATRRRRSRTSSSTRRTTRTSTRAISSSTFHDLTFYIGPEAIFGREPLGVRRRGHRRRWARLHPIRLRSTSSTGSPPEGRLDPPRLRARSHRQPRRRALRYFLLSTAARRVRKKGNRHATALVHTSQHVDVHDRTAEAIRAHLAHSRAGIARGGSELSCRSWQALWRSRVRTRSQLGLRPRACRLGGCQRWPAGRRRDCRGDHRQLADSEG